MLDNNITLALLVAYSVGMLALHTILHVEDRYGFPILPLCAVWLVIYGEKAIRQRRALGWQKLVPVACFAVVAWGLFVVQIMAWDASPFY